MGLSLKTILGGILILNLFVCMTLYVGVERPVNFLRRSFAYNRFENAPLSPYKLTREWQEYLEIDRFDEEHQGIKNEDDYCFKVAQYRAQNPAELDTNGMPTKSSRIIFSDYKLGNLVKTVIKRTGTMVMENHTIDDKEYEELEPLRPDINMFFHKSPSWHYKHKIDTHFLCPGQKYNHIPGHEHMTNKDEAADNNRAYGKYYKDRPECFDPWRFMPETYNLADKTQCLEIIERLKRDRRSDTIKWIRKKSRNSHNAEGVTIVTSEVADEILEEYQYGALCGKLEDHFIVQQYLDDPLLVNEKKFDFRVYMLIASLDPLIIFYHDGFLRVSLIDYDAADTEAMTHITNTQLAKDMLDEKNASQQEREETLRQQMWTFDQFEDHMVSRGLVDKNWIEDYVRPVMKVTMLHLVRMHYEKFLKHPGVFEMYGVDFMFDSKLHLWFLEVNRSPAMQATTEEKGRIQSKLIEDILDIEYGLLYKADLDKVVERSNFEWVFDGRRNGMERYFGLLTEDCL